MKITRVWYTHTGRNCRSVAVGKPNSRAPVDAINGHNFESLHETGQFSRWTNFRPRRSHKECSLMFKVLQNPFIPVEWAKPCVIHSHVVLSLVLIILKYDWDFCQAFNFDLWAEKSIQFEQYGLPNMYFICLVNCSPRLTQDCFYPVKSRPFPPATSLTTRKTPKSLPHWLAK